MRKENTFLKKIEKVSDFQVMGFIWKLNNMNHAKAAGTKRFSDKHTSRRNDFVAHTS